MRATCAISGHNTASIEEDFFPDPPDPAETADAELAVDDLMRFAAGCDPYYSLSMAIDRIRRNYGRANLPRYMRRRLLVAVAAAERAASVVLPENFGPAIIENGFRGLFVLASLWAEEKEEGGYRPKLPTNPSDPGGRFRAAADGWAHILQNSAHSMSLAQAIKEDGAWNSVAWLSAPIR